MKLRLVTGALFVGIWIAFVGTAAAQSDGSLVVNMSALSRNTAAPASPWPRLIHQHVSPTLPSGRGAVAPLTAPAATAAPLAPPPPTAPLNTFEGQGQTGWIPPDTNGAVSSAFVVTTVNNTITVRTRGGQQLSSVDLNDFWRPLPLAGQSFDTRSRFDPYGQRFIVMSSGALGDTPNSGILMAVSQTADPTGNWSLFRVKADATSDAWVDYPTLGFNKKWIMVSGNMFGSTAFFTRIWAFDKAALYSGRLAVRELPGVGTTAQGAETYDAQLEDLYILQLDSDSSVALHRLTGTVGSEHTELIASIPAPLSWFGPPSAPQLGSESLVPTGFDWMMDCVYRNGSIWGTHEVQPTTGPSRSAVQWWRVSPQGQRQDFGRIDDATGTFYYGMASVAANKNNDALIGFTRFSFTTFPSAGYAFRGSGDPAGTFRPAFIYRDGDGSYCCDRWGDFSHTLVDPADDVKFWTVQEYSAGDVGWGTWWAQVAPEGATSVAVKLKSGVVTDQTGSPHPQIQVRNTGTSALVLDSTAIRYWFNCDCTAADTLQGFADWAGLLPSGRAITSNVHVSFEPTTAGGQTHALLIQFTGGLVVAPGETVQIETRFNKASWSTMRQANDFSFAPFASYTDWNKVGVYSNGVLIAGQAP
jgi:hypothetical protein